MAKTLRHIPPRGISALASLSLALIVYSDQSAAQIAAPGAQPQAMLASGLLAEYYAFDPANTPTAPESPPDFSLGQFVDETPPRFDLAAFTAVPDLARFSQTAFPGMRWSGHLEISEAGQYVFAGELSVSNEHRQSSCAYTVSLGGAPLIEIAQANGGRHFHPPLDGRWSATAALSLDAGRHPVEIWLACVSHPDWGLGKPDVVAMLSWRSPSDSVLRPVPASVFVHNP
jgi:hypothetical protein